MENPKMRIFLGIFYFLRIFSLQILFISIYVVLTVISVKHGDIVHNIHNKKKTTVGFLSFTVGSVFPYFRP